MDPIPGLHHVTAIVSNPQRTLDFYTQALGLRFVKRTINFDDPGSYHLYFGDDAGTPGAILTFFAWPGARPGAVGSGETLSVAFSVPPASVDYWHQRLPAAGIPVQATLRFGDPVLAFTDPDGMQLEIIGHADPAPPNPSRDASILPEHAIRGFHSVTLAEAALPATEQVLLLMGYHRTHEESARTRFAAPGNALGSRIDVALTPHLGPGRAGAGAIHHIALRNPDDAAQLAWRAHLAQHQLNVTPVMDRTYFHSIYFREPGGVLFELATDPPGFTADEPLAQLGERLMLPPWLESKRAFIEKHLPPLQLHTLDQLKLQESAK